MASPFFSRFRRITYSTAYLPEVDGLRFLAIFSVVAIMHITNYLNDKFYDGQLLTNPFWKNFAIEGGNGVPLFFIISGFILSLPFARWRLQGEKKVELKNYYLRRLTRLEPPYLIALVIFFIAQVWVLHKFSFNGLLPHFLASASYLHTLVYQAFSPILPVAWSLEVEVQFYILAPVFCLLFLVPSKTLRWLIMAFIILVSSFYWYDNWHDVHVFKFLHFFFCGILLSDLYCNRVVLVKNKSMAMVIGWAALAGFIFIPSLQSSAGYYAKIACMFLLMHLVLANSYWKRIFSIQGLVIIGGMCYSIYLLHFAIVSLAGSWLLQLGFRPQGPLYFIPLAILLALLVLVIAALYFLLIEKPFMRPMGLKHPASAPVPMR